MNSENLHAHAFIFYLFTQECNKDQEISTTILSYYFAQGGLLSLLLVQHSVN